MNQIDNLMQHLDGVKRSAPSCNEAKPERRPFPEANTLGAMTSEAAPLDRDDETAAADRAMASIRDFQKHSRAELKRKPNTGFDLDELLRANLPEPKYICPPFIAEGLTLFAGRPKIGKTTLLRQLLIAANAGGEFFGTPCEHCNCLFLSLEEGMILARKKFLAMTTADTVSGIRIEFDWPRGTAGANAIHDYIRKQPMLRLVVVDSLSRFREQGNKQVPQFQQDYAAVSALQAVAKEHQGLAIVVVHHTTKASYDDPINCISGTYGLTAACDSYGVILCKDENFRLHWGGRLWALETNDFKLTRGNGLWHLAGPWDFESSGLPHAQTNIRNLLAREGPMRTRDISRRLDIGDSTASEHLKKMEIRGLVKKQGTDWTLA